MRTNVEERVSIFLNQSPAYTLGPLLFNYTVRFQRELKFARPPFLEEEYRRRNHYRDNADGCREVMVLPGFAKILVIDFYRESTEPFADKQRSSEVCEGPHENQQGRREDRGHCQSKDDLPYPTQPCAAHE